MEMLYTWLRGFIDVPAGLWEDLSESICVRPVKRKDYLLKAGHYCQDVWFVEKGLFKIYYMLGDIPVYTQFVMENQPVFSFSLFAQKTSAEFIEAFEDSEVLQINYTVLKKLCLQYPELKELKNKLLKQYFLDCRDRLHVLQTMNAPSRYRHLLDQHPELILRVPAKFLAGYLGISEITLSILKSRNLF